MLLISSAISLFNVLKVNALEWLSLINRECTPRPKILDVNEGIGEALFYPYNVLVNKCSGSCNMLNDPMARICVPNIIKNVNKSALAQVTCGVPQGSILGPILFNLYVTGISTFTSSKCLQLADDTTLYKRCKVKDIPDCANIIQNDVEHLKAWSDVNSLVFNGTKTKAMIFSTK